MMSKSPSKAPAPEPPQVVIRDPSLIEDLWNAGILELALQLPYRFVMALPVSANGLAHTDRNLVARLQTSVEVIDLDGSQVSAAMDMMSRFAGLSALDCLTIVLAREFPKPILLTHDAQLQLVSKKNFGIEVRTVLWIVELLDQKILPDRVDACLSKLAQ